MKKETRQLLARLNKDYKKFYREERDSFMSLYQEFDSYEVYHNALEKLRDSIDLPRIGEGSSRQAFLLEDGLVLKVATSEAGLEQNKVEAGIKSEFVCKVHRKEPHVRPAWLVVDHCTRADRTNIKERFKMSPKQFDQLLHKYLYKKHGVAPSTLKVHNTDVAKKFVNFIVKNDMAVGDLMSHRMANYGINPKGKLVIVDAGLTEKVWQNYY